MSHVVLLGDSIFDNERYVPDRPPVIEQVRRHLPAGWQATLLAIDGHMIEDVSHQLKRLPADATHQSFCARSMITFRAWAAPRRSPWPVSTRSSCAKRSRPACR